MQARNDFLNPDKNKKKESFPVNKHKPIFIIGLTKDNEIINEYVQSEDELKETLSIVKKKCNKDSIKIYGIWAGKWVTSIFDLTPLYN
jgi:hypothetical protein